MPVFPRAPVNSVFVNTNWNTAFRNSFPVTPENDRIHSFADTVRQDDRKNHVEAPVRQGSPFTQDLFTVYNFYKAAYPSNSMVDKVTPVNGYFPLWENPVPALTLNQNQIVNPNIGDKTRFAGDFNELAANVENLKNFERIKLKDNYSLAEAFNSLAYQVDKTPEAQLHTKLTQEFDLDDNHIAYSLFANPGLGLADNFEVHRFNFRSVDDLIGTADVYRVLKPHIDNLYEKITGIPVGKPDPMDMDAPEGEAKRTFDDAFGDDPDVAVQPRLRI